MGNYMLSHMIYRLLLKALTWRGSQVHRAKAAGDKLKPLGLRENP